MVTQTQLKLSDAGTQMRLALQNTEVDYVFRSCINAFISAARSVTFVMQAESADHQELVTWYETQRAGLKENPLMSFFQEARTHTIHRGVVVPGACTYAFSDYQTYVEEKPGRGAVPCVSFHITGSAEPPAQPGDVAHLTTDGRAIIWTFEGVERYIPGDSGNVARLCEGYFIILKNLVASWLLMRERLGITDVSD